MLIMFDEFISQKEKTIMIPYIEDSNGKCIANPLAKLEHDIWAKRGRIGIKFFEEIPEREDLVLRTGSIVKFILYGNKILLLEQKMNIDLFVPLTIAYSIPFLHTHYKSFVDINGILAVRENTILDFNDLKLFIESNNLETNYEKVENFIVNMLMKSRQIEPCKPHLERLLKIRDRMINTEFEGEKQNCKSMYIKTINRIINHGDN